MTWKAKSVIESFSSTEVVVLNLKSGNRKVLKNSLQAPLDYDVIKKIWEDIEF